MTASATPFATGSLTGVLSSGGSDLLRVTVYTSRTPTVPPTQLAAHLSPVYDPDGQLRDWRLVPHGAGDDTADEFKRYRTWRAGYCTERYVGERALTRVFLDWVAPHCDVSALSALRLPAAHVDWHTAMTMRWQLENARRFCDSSDQIGLGIFTSPDKRSPTRTLLPTSPPTTALATLTTSVSSGPDGLILAGPLSSGQTANVVVRGWTAAQNGAVIAHTDDGEVHLEQDGDAARLLHVIGRHAPHVDVRAMPLRLLVAPLMVFFAEAAELAAAAHTGLYTRSGWL
jgi:hypothetical protein